MSETLQVDSQDDGEPPSSGRDDFIATIMEQVDRHTGATRYTSAPIGRHETRLRLAEGMIIADLGESACNMYAQLSFDERIRLEDDMIHEMRWLADDESASDARALCNSAPVLFEPFGHEMLLGERDSDDRWLRLEAHNISTHEQKRILVGGLAVLLWRLEQVT